MIVTQEGLEFYRWQKWSHRLKHAPNILAFSRVLMAPLMFLFLVNRDLFECHPSWCDYFAALVFTLASITDFFDGYIARNFDAKSKLGEILDPLADKMLVLAGFLGLMMIDRANPWAIYIILVREFFITGLRIQMASEGKKVAASMAGKVKTVAQMGAIGFLTMNWYGGEVLLWVAVILTVYSGFDYIKVYLSNEN
ncbi:MAG: CDP-diacylglycerol--glycerol-3-phosphate 3-phosphatidyltransferase [Epsilonproteobacteria bacterium]|nr:CDP-diacylglycerol--glycerol-3-phosphate 3-phosphatidyltransferase [Campylobacterota bacterium]